MASSVSQSQSSEPSLGRFLYTQNPFYLISCGFVLYGLFVATSSMGDQLAKASFLTGSLTIYAAIMALTALCVIRLAKVWDDARTILLVVVIALVACSVAVDELCVSNNAQAAKLLTMGGVAAILLSEFVLWSCGIRFAFWYRAAYYGFLTVFFASPLVAGSFRSISRELSNWSPLLFSIAIGAATLLLVPIVRRGKELAEDNGTPWNWPLFPLSLFVVLIVVGAIRSHAIWMSFGSLRGDVVFEPLLLMPLLLSVLVLHVESAAASQKMNRASFVIWAGAVLLLCGVTSLAKRPTSFHSAIAPHGGSTMTVALAMLAVFYLYAVARRVPGAMYALPLVLFWLGIVGKRPEAFAEYGFEMWMITAAGCVVCYVLTYIRSNDEPMWLLFTMMTAVTILVIGYRHGELGFAIPAAFAWTLAMFMFLGSVFDSAFAQELRRTAGIGWMIVSVAAALWSIIRDPGLMPIYGLAAVFVLSFVYLLIVRRRNWLHVSGLSAACAFAAFGQRISADYGVSLFDANHWQLKLGCVFFMVGALITTSKAEGHQRNQKAIKGLGTGWGLKSGF